MTINKRSFGFGVLFTLGVAAFLFLGIRIAYSTAPLLAFGSATPTPTPPAGQVIHMKPIAKLSSLSAMAKINAKWIDQN